MLQLMAMAAVAGSTTARDVVAAMVAMVDIIVAHDIVAAMAAMANNTIAYGATATIVATIDSAIAAMVAGASSAVACDITTTMERRPTTLQLAALLRQWRQWQATLQLAVMVAMANNVAACGNGRQHCSLWRYYGNGWQRCYGDGNNGQ
jgi:hypothetical protein